VIGEFDGNAHGEFAELEEVGLFEIEPVDAFAEGVNVAKFGKIVGDGMDNLAETAAPPARGTSGMDL
jgi:hypothetical protein